MDPVGGAEREGGPPVPPRAAGTGIGVEYHEVLVRTQPSLDQVISSGQTRLPGTDDHNL